MKRRARLPLFLLAVAMAVVIKIAVNEAVQLAETTINAQVQYNLPQGAMILEPIQQLAVRLRGERSDIASLNPFNVQVEVSLADLAEKDSGSVDSVDVTEDRLKVRAPGDFDVISITPNRLTLRIDRVIIKPLPVRAVPTGEPAAGAVLQGDPVVEPSTAQVEGPRSRINALGELTAPVSLDGHAFSFDPVVTLVSTDPLVRIVGPRQVVVAVKLKVPGTDTELDGLVEEPDQP